MKYVLSLALASALFAVTFAADVLTDVVDPYLRIQTALAADSMTGVKESAATIAAAAEQLGPKAASLKTSAERLGSAADLEAARAAFSGLSDALLGYAEDTRAGLGADTGTAYCPMVKKYWVQKKGQIENPYGGKSMVHCGEFVTARKK